MCARDLALLAQPPFCFFSHRCSFHFLSWQFRLGVETGVVPSTQGLPSCAKSGWGRVPKRNMPHRGQSLHQGSCEPCLVPVTMLSRKEGSFLQSSLTPLPPTPTPSSTHTSELLGQKSLSFSAASKPCLGRVSHLLPLLSLACQAPLTRDTTHTYIHTEKHMRAHSCSHMLTQIYM
jgi:hypothetical protein